MKTLVARKSNYTQNIEIFLTNGCRPSTVILKAVYTHTRIKQVGTFKYLGFTITPDTRCDTEIKQRISLTKDTFTKSIFTNRNIRIYTNIKTLKAYMVHTSVWMWMLDTDKRPRKKTWISRNVVHQKNKENIMDWKEVKRGSNGNGQIQKIPTQNHHKKKPTVLGAYKQSWWIKKANIECKGL